MEFIVFEPLFQERVWGGRDLARLLGRTLPGEQPIGESWEVVDRAEAQSVVREGPRTGDTLRSLIETASKAVMGPGWPPQKAFPVLVKWLDCQKRLSLQVHPPASVVGELQGQPKTENWYIAHSQPGAGLLAGLRQGVSRDQFEAALREERLEPLVHRIEVQPGDSMFIPSGRIHAIDAGNLILEIQQNSDTTYRVYDWGRAGLDGQPRQLHIEESLKSIAFDDFEPEPLRPAPQARETVLTDAAEFRIRCFQLGPADEPLRFAADEEPRLIHLVEGRLKESVSGRELARGDNALQPFAGAASFVAAEPSVVLVTDRFASPRSG